MSKHEKLAALIADLLKVAEKHKMVVNKYAKASGPTEYYLKLPFEDVEVNIDKVFPVVYYGPEKATYKVGEALSA